MAEEIPPLVRSFLREDYAAVDAKLPAILAELRRVGATECWHKKSTFAQHLFEVYKMLTLWGQSEELRHCGLLHSAYSNCYVNLAVFKADADRPHVAGLVGQGCEALIFRFCTLDRHDLIYTQLLDKVPEGGPYVVPEDGVMGRNIKTGERERVGVYELGQFLVFTIADFCDQLMSWQDDMFENTDGLLRYAGHEPKILWPAEVKPGRWMHALSKMAALLRSCNARLAAAGDARRFPLPPLFGGCAAVVGAAEELRARDAYWRAVTELRGPGHQAEAMAALAAAAADNPYIAEPHALLAQLHLQAGDSAAAEAAALTALRLLCDWGTCWDKRMQWSAWVAWVRALLLRARQGEGWPKAPFGVLNYGLVEGL
ncbi:MAG: hypothetical protein J3K34DRAFT_434644 [Monoraphidium minutum]|nr:MAG: hypothetical protein J3K34DRAFT_434644 [Monoraphidium minutum]